MQTKLKQQQQLIRIINLTTKLQMRQEDNKAVLDPAPFEYYNFISTLFKTSWKSAFLQQQKMKKKSKVKQNSFSAILLFELKIDMLVGQKKSMKIVKHSSFFKLTSLLDKEGRT